MEPVCNRANENGRYVSLLREKEQQNTGKGWSRNVVSRERERERERERQTDRQTDTDLVFLHPINRGIIWIKNKYSSKQVQSISKRINIKCKKFKHAYANIKRKCSELVPSVLLFNKHTGHVILSTLSSNLSIPDNKNCMYNIYKRNGQKEYLFKKNRDITTVTSAMWQDAADSTGQLSSPSRSIFLKQEPYKKAYP